MFVKGKFFLYGCCIGSNKPSKCNSKINEKVMNNRSTKLIWKMIWFWLTKDFKVIPQMLPEFVQESILGPPWAPSGPKIFQEGLRDPICTICNRCWTNFGRKFDRMNPWGVPHLLNHRETTFLSRKNPETIPETLPEFPKHIRWLRSIDLDPLT